MAKYGNILALFDPDEETITILEAILTSRQVIYTYFKFLFFIETTSMRNTSDVVKDLKDAGVHFFFFHNHIPDGSQVRANGMDEEFLRQIDKVLFK